MAEEDLGKELEALRAQVAELAAAREAQEKQRAQRESEPAAAEVSEEAPSEGTDLGVQVEEFIETLGKEIKQTKATTLLVVFAVGVLVGRLLPR